VVGHHHRIFVHESQFPKLDAAGSNPISRSIRFDSLVFEVTRYFEAWKVIDD
jgi:hypothetical protein